MHCFEVDSELVKGLRGDCLAFENQPEEQVLGADEAVVQSARFPVGSDHHAAGALGEALEDGSMVPRARRMAHWRSGGAGRRQPGLMSTEQEVTGRLAVGHLSARG